MARIIHAATYAAPSEAEAGAVRGAASATVSTGASGGKSVLFGSAPAPPACSKDPSLFKIADLITISTSAPGLTKVIDPTAYYKVNDYTAQQIRDQINACTPIAQDTGEFDAITTWRVQYAYNWYTKPNGLCAAKDVAVGVHINYLFPQWTSSPQAAEGLDARWQTYITNMTTHENGHRDIALQRSQQLLTDLQNFPDTNCSTIQKAVTDFSNNAINALNAASDDYDTQTQHGLTQGTKFP